MDGRGGVRLGLGWVGLGWVVMAHLLYIVESGCLKGAVLTWS